MRSISAIIIAKNEEVMLGECLNSLSFCDEIILVDNDSTDQTTQIAKKKGAVVVKGSTNNFSKLRELGAKVAKSEYLFYVDADERVSEKLKQEIKAVLDLDNPLPAYSVSRKNFYLGGKKPWPTIEHLERVFAKSKLKGWKGELHETAQVEGEIGTLSQPLYHFTHRDLSSMVEKTNAWSETEAKLRFNANHPKVTWWRFPRVMITAFWDSYIKQKGYKAGTVGLLESMYQSFSIFITYAKLWEMQEKK